MPTPAEEKGCARNTPSRLRVRTVKGAAMDKNKNKNVVNAKVVQAQEKPCPGQLGILPFLSRGHAPDCAPQSSRFSNDEGGGGRDGHADGDGGGEGGGKLPNQAQQQSLCQEANEFQSYHFKLAGRRVRLQV
jgi:hypothetical protein